LREDLVEKLYSVSRAYFNHADLGGLHTTIVQDTERLDVMSNALVAQVLPALVTCLVLAPVLLILNWLLFLVLFAAAPAAAWVSRLLGRRMRGRTRAFRAES